MSAIGALTSSAVQPQRDTDSDAFSDLSSAEFLDIVLTELSNQDPLDPNDTQALIEQISLLRSIESDIDVTEALESVAEQNEFASASVLIGATVRGLDEGFADAEGVVVSVGRTPEGPVLRLTDGSRVPFERVEEVTLPVVPEQPVPEQPVPPAAEAGSEAVTRERRDQPGRTRDLRDLGR